MALYKFTYLLTYLLTNDFSTTHSVVCSATDVVS